MSVHPVYVDSNVIPVNADGAFLEPAKGGCTVPKIAGLVVSMLLMVIYFSTIPTEWSGIELKGSRAVLSFKLFSYDMDGFFPNFNCSANAKGSPNVNVDGNYKYEARYTPCTGQSSSSFQALFPKTQVVISAMETYAPIAGMLVCAALAFSFMIMCTVVVWTLGENDRKENLGLFVTLLNGFALLTGAAAPLMIALGSNDEELESAAAELRSLLLGSSSAAKYTNASYGFSDGMFLVGVNIFLLVLLSFLICWEHHKIARRKETSRMIDEFLLQQQQGAVFQIQPIPAELFGGTQTGHAQDSQYSGEHGGYPSFNAYEDPSEMQRPGNSQADVYVAQPYSPSPA
eukprot:ANDGO_03534.mRNA.1 hypothetical protein